MKLKEIPIKILEYTTPRPTTQGDSSKPSAARAAIVGGLKGYFSSFRDPVTAFSGISGGYLGVKIGEKTESSLMALSSGSGIGAISNIALTASLLAISGAPITPAIIAVSGLLGGFSGLAGTLAGSRRASTRDSVYGGAIAGAIAAAFTRNPFMILAGAAGSGMAGMAAKPAGKVVLGIITGLLTGAVSGIMGGPWSILTGAITGALVSSSGSIIGPALMQMQRNIEEDLSNKGIEKLRPFLKKHKLNKFQKIALGSFAGALGFAPLGIIFGLKGLIVTTAIGAVSGAISTYKLLKQKEKFEKELLKQKETLNNNLPPSKE